MSQPPGLLPAGLEQGAADRERRAALLRMKAVAGGGLLLAALIFLVCTVLGSDAGGWPYLQAASEAAMVGGLADWFAVTALFRHPLGLPIPHTAIIPRKKDQIGESLGTFVQQNFLTPEVVAPRLQAAEIPRRVGEWLALGDRPERLAAEFGVALSGANTVLADDDIRLALGRFADSQLRRLPAAPVVAKVIELGVQGDQHQILLTEGLRAVMRFLDDNRELFRQRLAEESPDWVPDWVDGKVFNRLFSGVQNFLADVTGDPEHPLRRQFDDRLRRLRRAAANRPGGQRQPGAVEGRTARPSSGPQRTGIALAAVEEGGAGGGRGSGFGAAPGDHHRHPAGRPGAGHRRGTAGQVRPLAARRDQPCAGPLLG